MIKAVDFTPRPSFGHIALLSCTYDVNVVTLWWTFRGAIDNPRN